VTRTYNLQLLTGNSKQQGEDFKLCWMERNMRYTLPKRQAPMASWYLRRLSENCDRSRSVCSRTAS